MSRIQGSAERPATVPALVLSLVLVGAVQSQAPVAVVELDAKAMADKGVVLQRDGGSGKEKMVVMVGWGEIKIPFEKPVTECAVGLVRGGKELVVLAGGVRSSLDLYLVQDDGSFQRYATDGGRRLPRKFNGGAGSWPIVEGRHLLLFGYEKGAGIEFRALDFDGRVLLERRVKASVEGFSVKSDPDRGEVRVEFGSGPKPSTIRHPVAPRLELSRWGLIDFLEVEVGSKQSSVSRSQQSREADAAVEDRVVEEGIRTQGSAAREARSRKDASPADRVCSRPQRRVRRRSEFHRERRGRRTHSPAPRSGRRREAADQGRGQAQKAPRIAPPRPRRDRCGVSSPRWG